MASDHLPDAKFTVGVKQIETEDGTLVFEVTASSDLNSYREVQRHGIGGYGGCGAVLTVDGVHQLVVAFRQRVVDALATKLAMHQAFSQLS